MYVKVYSREYANALDSMLLDQFKDLSNLFVAAKPRIATPLVGIGERTIDAMWDRRLA